MQGKAVCDDREIEQNGESMFKVCISSFWLPWLLNDVHRLAQTTVMEVTQKC